MFPWMVPRQRLSSEGPKQAFLAHHTSAWLCKIFPSQHSCPECFYPVFSPSISPRVPLVLAFQQSLCFHINIIIFTNKTVVFNYALMLASHGNLAKTVYVYHVSQISAIFLKAESRVLQGNPHKMVKKCVCVCACVCLFYLFDWQKERKISCINWVTLQIPAITRS